MNKLFKVLTAVAVVIMLIACVGVFVACNDNNDVPTPDNTDKGSDVVEETYVYKFTVKDTDGNPIEGIQVQLCKGSAFCIMPKETDANGVVTFDSYYIETPDVYDIHVLNEDYVFDNSAYKTSTSQKDYELTLSK